MAVPTQDRRVRRTRTALRDALLALMTEKGYEAVTVQDLIDRADVGRSTFYAHFTDKADLLHDALTGLRGILDAEPDTAAGARPGRLRFSLVMFRHVADQQPLLRALLGHPGTAAVITQIEALLLDVVRRELDALVPPGTTPRVPVDLLSTATVASYLATLTWWVGSDFRQTPEEMDAFFQRMVTPGIRAALATPRPVPAREIAGCAAEQAV
jgi:AcrR family transcriptional regulator